jgi:hypothetical protein
VCDLFPKENIAVTRLLVGLPLLSFSLSPLLLFLLLLVRRLEHNTAGVFGGALYYDSCSRLDKACFVQGMGLLSGSRAILVRNNRARAGGAVFVECSNIGVSCTEAFGDDNKIGALPQLPKVELAGNSASAYGNNVATKATTMLDHEGANRSIIELVPGQELLSVAVKLYDSQGSLIKGSDDIIEMIICPDLKGACTALSASLPAGTQGFNSETGLGNIQASVECALAGQVRMSTMLFSIRVVGADHIDKISGRVLCNMCKIGQRMITHTSRGTWSCTTCLPGTYNVEPLTGVCFVCPSSATCVNGVPIFGASTAMGVIEMKLVEGSSDDKIRDALAIRIGIHVWQITSVLAHKQQKQRSSQKIEFTFVSNTTQIADLTSRLKSLGAELGNSAPLGPQLAAGEVWKEVDGRFLLRSCPPGHQLLNSTTDGSLDKNAQRCLPCKSNTYIIDQMFPCLKCPRGATCPDGVAFFSNEAGSEWADKPAAGGGLQKRILSCPAGERDREIESESKSESLVWTSANPGSTFIHIQVCIRTRSEQNNNVDTASHTHLHTCMHTCMHTQARVKP